jgi:hypothetical protein
MKMKDFGNSKIIKVKCCICGKDIECPEEMMKTSKKHMCYLCFQNPKNFKKFSNDERKNVHVDIPVDNLMDTIADNFMSMIVNELFPNLWSEKKEYLKELSKKNLSKEMFSAGVYMGIQSFMDYMKEMEKNNK